MYPFHVPRIMFLISRLSSCKLSMCFSLLSMCFSMTACSLLDASSNSFFKSFMSFLVASVRPNQNIPANIDNKVAKGILSTSPFNTSKLPPHLIHAIGPHSSCRYPTHRCTKAFSRTSMYSSQIRNRVLEKNVINHEKQFQNAFTLYLDRADLRTLSKPRT